MSLYDILRQSIRFNMFLQSKTLYKCYNDAEKYNIYVGIWIYWRQRTYESAPQNRQPGLGTACH